MEFEQAEFIDLSFFLDSSIWDVMDAPAALVNKKSKIEFQLKIRLFLKEKFRIYKKVSNYRRKALFYTVVLIIPTVLMAFLSMAVFFLPTDSGFFKQKNIILKLLKFFSKTFKFNRQEFLKD